MDWTRRYGPGRMTQHRFVKHHIDAHVAIGDSFALDSVYEWCEIGFRKYWPDNRHVRKTITKQLQYLRRDRFIEFTDYRGRYRRLR